MNEIAKVLANLHRKGRKAFAPFVLAGYPDLGTTGRMLRGLADLGADLIEVGLPFSDPMADGATIQAAAHTALMNGAKLDGIMGLVAGVAPKLSCPLTLFSYLNPIIRRGVGNFLAQASQAGFTGLIVPDLPPEAAGQIQAEAERLGLGLTFLVAPTSTLERIRIISEASTGFLYAVSVRGVTGARRTLPPDLSVYLKRVKTISDRPVLVGFGISTPEQAREAASMADGAIAASALIPLLDAGGPDAALELAAKMCQAVHEMSPAAPL